MRIEIIEVGSQSSGLTKTSEWEKVYLEDVIKSGRGL